MTDQPRYRATSRSLDVGYVFGVLSASELTGPVLVRMLDGLHLAESAARNQLTKMVRMGALTSTRVGRTARYALADQPRRKFQQVEGTSGKPLWDGQFHCIVYDIPERERAYRDRFRYQAGFNGYGQLRPGVLISTHRHSEGLDEVIAARPPGSRIHLADLCPSDTEQARAMTAQAWDLPDIAARYTRVIEAIAAAHRAGPGEGVDDDPWPATQRLNRLYRQVLEVQLADPNLPDDLLPPRWPRADYWALLAALNSEWGPKIQPVLRRIAADLDPHGLCRYYPAPWHQAGYGS